MIDTFKTVIISKLKALFPQCKVYDEDIQQGLSTPSFFMHILDVQQDKKFGKNVERIYPVSLVYFPEDEDSYHTECDTVLETLMNDLYRLGEGLYAHRITGAKHDRTLIINFQLRVQLLDIRSDGSELMNTLEVQ